MKALVRIGCLAFSLGCWALMIGLLSGCAAMIGIKEYRGSDGSVMKFVTGYDIGASASGIDVVDNRKAINPDGK